MTLKKKKVSPFSGCSSVRQQKQPNCSLLLQGFEVSSTSSFLNLSSLLSNSSFPTSYLLSSLRSSPTSLVSSLTHLLLKANAHQSLWKQGVNKPIWLDIATQNYFLLLYFFFFFFQPDLVYWLDLLHRQCLRWLKFGKGCPERNVEAAEVGE